MGGLPPCLIQRNQVFYRLFFSLPVLIAHRTLTTTIPSTSRKLLLQVIHTADFCGQQFFMKRYQAGFIQLLNAVLIR